jgi:hypothetical protein
MLGIALSLDETVTVRQPPQHKSWETCGEPRLLVIGAYRMGLRIEAAGTGSLLTVSIDYDLPRAGAARLLAPLLAPAVCPQVLPAHGRGRAPRIHPSAEREARVSKAPLCKRCCQPRLAGGLRS